MMCNENGLSNSLYSAGEMTTFPGYTSHRQPPSYSRAGQFSWYCFLCMLFVWVVLQPLSMYAALPSSIRLPMLPLKNIMGAVCVVWAMIDIVVSKKGISQGISPLMAVSVFLFPVYATLQNFVIGGTAWQELLLYWLWIAAAYFIMPTYIRSRDALNQVVAILLVSNLCVLTVSILQSAMSGMIYWRYTSRVAFDFINPNFYAYSWQVCVPLFLYLLIQSKRSRIKIVLACLIIISITFIWLAKARGALSFCIVLLGAYAVMTRTIKTELILSFVFFLFALLLLFSSPTIVMLEPVSAPQMLESLNDYSSGRINIWRQSIAYSFSNSTALDYIAGLGDYARIGFAGDTLDAVAEGYRFDRRHIDNAYVGLFMQFGLLGFVLFFFPILTIVLRSQTLAALSTGRTRKINALVFGSWLGFLVHMITAPVIPSFGNVLNIFVLTILFPITLSQWRETENR